MKKLLFSALVGAMIISCSRDNDNTNPTTPQTPAISQTVILPTKLTYSQTGKADEVITFSYNGNKLMKVTRDNKDVIYTYTGDLITSINNPNESSHVFNYDSNGNLISEKEESYSGTIKVLEENTTYTINGSTVKAQKISKNYDDITGTLSSISTSTITYTLDAKKRPIKSVEVSEERDSTGNLIEKTNNNTTTYQYANHHSLIENIVGFDKLTYSDFLSNNEDFPHNIVSYMKEDINRTYYHFGGSPHNESYINEVKVEYSVNANNYPIKIQPKAKNHINRQFENRNNSYFTIEYNK
jgi:lipoprotein